ncbi:protein kinase [uncultured Paenibacillus sp.]|uniref:serine/threonine protein kinase n=1 Tax=uncultured Paenibacillus sp. TaxID=227322 RepID=UPI0015AF50F5|nr:protein kinase [uncultured Paenibacillus sp.]
MRFLSFFGTFRAAWRDYRAEPNTLLGQRYLIKSLIGEGSYGLTYLGIDRTDERLVAIKQARPSKGSLARQLLEREARILRSLDHPRLPAFKEMLTIGRQAYLVMSVLEGETLEDLIFEQERRFGEADCARITLQLLELVRYIHQQGIVHLDLRIPNLLMHEGELSIIDFGLARAVGEAPFSIPSFRSSHRKTVADLEASRLASPAEPQSDLLDVGHFMLFLLYSTFESPRPALNAKEQSWQEELALSPHLIEIIERLLGLRDPYTDASDAIEALRAFLSPSVDRPVSFASNNEYNRM